MAKTKTLSPAEKKKRAERKHIRSAKMVLGDFVIQFEEIMDGIRDTIHLIFNLQGFKNRHQVNILLHDAQAHNLWNYYLAFIKETQSVELQKSEDARKYFSKLLDFIKEALELRNKVLHSTWYLYPYEQGKNNVAFVGFRQGVNKEKGLKNHFDSSPTKSEFQDFIKSFKLLAKAVEQIRENIEVRQSILIKKVDLKKVSFKWQGVDFYHLLSIQNQVE